MLPYAFANVIFLLTVLPFPSSQMVDSPSHNSQLLSESEWLNFLMDSPDHTETDKSRMIGNTPIPSSPTRVQHDVLQPYIETPRNEAAREKKERKSRKGKGKKDPNQKRLERTLKYQLLSAEERKPYLESSRVRSRRYRAKLKGTIGYSNLQNARMRQYRILEKIGEISPEQQAALTQHREKKRLSYQKSILAKKKPIIR